MKLNYKVLGEGEPVIVLHGLLGMLDNWQAPARLLQDSFQVILVDLRNHGHSPHSEEHNYSAMMNDVLELMDDLRLSRAHLLGHSMGGKVVMKLAQHFPARVNKLIVADIGPKFYPTHHNHILDGLNAIDVNKLENRKDAEDIFSNYVSDFGERQFILKNLYRTDEGGFDWRINIPVISKEIYQVGGEVLLEKRIEKPALIIRGADSSYVKDADFQSFKSSFVNAELITIEGANHWVHAIKPIEFVSAT